MKHANSITIKESTDVYPALVVDSDLLGFTGGEGERRVVEARERVISLYVNFYIDYDQMAGALASLRANKQKGGV